MDINTPLYDLSKISYDNESCRHEPEGGGIRWVLSEKMGIPEWYNRLCFVEMMGGVICAHRVDKVIGRIRTVPNYRDGVEVTWISIPGTRSEAWINSCGDIIRLGFVPGSKKKVAWYVQRKRELGNTDYYVFTHTRASRTLINCASNNIPIQRVMMMAWWPEEFYPNQGLTVDHINGDMKDNRLCNLQLITQAENNRLAREKRRK